MNTARFPRPRNDRRAVINAVLDRAIHFAQFKQCFMESVIEKSLCTDLIRLEFTDGRALVNDPLRPGHVVEVARTGFKNARNDATGKNGSSLRG